MTPKINPSDIVTIQQLAGRASITPPMVLRHIRDGKIAATLIGNTWLITSDEARHYLARRAAGEFKPGKPKKYNRNETNATQKY